jgi:hypothetical protein
MKKLVLGFLFLFLIACGSNNAKPIDNVEATETSSYDFTSPVVVVCTESYTSPSKASKEATAIVTEYLNNGYVLKQVYPWNSFAGYVGSASVIFLQFEKVK